MEPKKFASVLEDDVLSLSGRDGVSLPLFRPQSPTPSGRFTLRRSIQSNRSSFSAASSHCSASLDPAALMSCVTRETSKDDCGTDRFVVWAAVKRNTSDRMTDRERLECPLLRCTLRFPDHESMLRHLVSCEHLSSCEYWCYDHMRIERFDDSRCRKCLGHASKRRKMLSMAKHFFTAIGHTKGKSIAGDPFPSSPSFLSTSVSDFGCDCISRNGSSHHSHSHRDDDRSRRNSSCHRAGGPSATSATSTSSSSSSASYPPSFSFFGPPPPDCEAINGNNHAELPTTSELPVEIDSRELAQIPRQFLFEPIPVGPTAAGSPDPVSVSPVASLPAVETQPSSINPQDLLLPELESMNWESNEVAMPSISAVIDNSGISASFPSFLDVQESNEMPYSDDVAGGSRPLLQLHIQQSHDGILGQLSCGAQPPSQRAVRPSAAPAPRSKNLSPSSSVRSTTSTTSTTSALSAMSDMSAASYSSAATTVSLISNVGSLVSPISDCSYGSNQWPTDLETGQTSPMSNFNDLFSDDLFAGAEETISTDVCEELSLLTDDSFLLDVDIGAETELPKSSGSAPLLFDFEAPLPSARPQAGPTEPCITATSSTNVEANTSTGISEIEAFVATAWYLLLTHITTSATKLRRMGMSNRLATLLRQTSPVDIAKTGMQTLRTALISGDENTTPFATLCFLHAIYAFSLITYGPEAASRSDELFTQALVYSRNFTGPDRDSYLQIITVIWQPSNTSLAVLAQHIQSPLFDLGKNASAPSSGLAIDNPVIATAKAYLDDLEASVIMGPTSPSEVHTSSLLEKHTKHLGAENSADFISSASAVLKTLIREFPRVDGRTRDFNEIGRRVATGSLRSVRKFELGLYQAGKASLGCSATFFDLFVPRLRRLCDHIYAIHTSAGNQRLAYYEASTLLVLTIFEEMDNGLGRNGLPADERLYGTLSPIAMAKVGDKTQLLLPFTGLSENNISLLSTTQPYTAAVAGSPTPSTMEVEFSGAEEAPSAETPAGQKVEVESDACCQICSYRPKGDPQWFRGSMNKHMKTKHSGEVIYKCPYPNCNSQYRNRLDNLQQHQREKNHFVGSEQVVKKARRQSQTEQTDSISEQGSSDGTGATRRPSKRKKLSD
ncbi:zinc finger protein [Grosmannia clavigera kw1407]|uniref:Zinc finger protein n=1 Tax=Grosmannia clavigera (strain kw1407 / UAMH 11150) TaxID=655863 RepID=F0XFG5_GROCL|nr:zinc finger protein [Grosmannia clavigera kw1407]EFX04145.1 zinc finger protein [Grosmannia clavigera kw1407]